MSKAAIKTATQKRFGDVNDVAKMSSLCTRTVQQMYREEGMPHLKVGRAVRFDLEKAATWLEKKYGQNCEVQ